MLQRNSVMTRPHMLSIRAAILCVILLLSAPLGAQTTVDQLPDSVLVLVNGEPITTGHMDAEFMAIHDRMEGEMRMDFDYDKLVKKLVNDRLITQEAAAMGMGEEAWLVDYLETVRLRRAIQAYIKDAYDPTVEVTEPMMKQYFDSLYHRMQYRTLTVRTISEATDLRERIIEGADMDSLARQLSLDTYKVQGGLSTFKHWADIQVIFRDVLRGMKPGELSRPFPFREAYTIIRLEKKQAADPEEYPFFENTIKGRMTSELQEKQWMAFVDSLAGLVTVTRHEATLAAIRNDSAKLFTERFTNYSPAPALTVPSGVKMTEGDLRTEISHSAMASATTPFGELFEESLEQARQKVVLGEMALQSGYGDSSAVIEAYEHSLDSALIEAYVKEQVVSKITFTHEEFSEYYESHPDEFRADEQFRLFQATLESEEDAKEFVSRLKEGADFAYLKKRYGLAELASDQSEEWITISSFPKIIREDFESLDIGEVAGPYATTTGWAVFELKDRRPGRLKRIDEVNMEIRQALFQEKFNALMDEHLEILKKHSEIVYNQDAIDAYFRRGDEG